METWMLELIASGFIAALSGLIAGIVMSSLWFIYKAWELDSLRERFERHIRMDRVPAANAGRTKQATEEEFIETAFGIIHDAGATFEQKAGNIANLAASNPELAQALAERVKTDTMLQMRIGTEGLKILMEVAKRAKSPPKDGW